MRRGITGALAVALVAVGATGVSLAGGSHGSTPYFDDAQPLDDSSELYVTGHVKTNFGKCLKDRKVKVYLGYNTEPKYRLVDVAVSSEKGQFAGQGPDTHNGNEAVAGKVKLL